MSDLHQEAPTPKTDDDSQEKASAISAEPRIEAAEADVAASAEPDTEAPAVEPEAEAVEAAAEPEAETVEAAAEPEAEAIEAAAEPEAEAVEAAAEPEAEAVEAAAQAESAEAGVEAASAEGQEESPASADAPAAGAVRPDQKSEPSEAMAELEQALAGKLPVKGQVIGWNKGGYHVAIGKIAAFCPVSQIEIGNPRSPKQYLDKTFSFLVIEIQKGGRRVVLSRAEALKAEREQRATLVRELLKPGAEVEGRVSSLTSFGAFVDLGGGIEGLVLVSEISRQRVVHPKEVLESGQEVKVSVLKIEKGGQRISLSIKRLEPDPWKGVGKRHPAGSEFTGKILRQTDFGLFVEVEPGLEGLVHTSRLGFGQTLEHEDLQVGNEISGWVHEVESRRRRLSLSLREVVGGNPWQGVNDRYPVGDVVKGRVERLASFGVFIELEPGLTGLLPFAVLGGGGGNPRRQYHAGKEVSVRVLSIDRQKKRISLGTEASKAEGNQQDYRDYMKTQRTESKAGGGLSVMAAAFAKLKEQRPKTQA